MQFKKIFYTWANNLAKSQSTNQQIYAVFKINSIF